MKLIVLDFAKLSMIYKLAATENKITVAEQHRKAGNMTSQNNAITEIQFAQDFLEGLEESLSGMVIVLVSLHRRKRDGGSGGFSEEYGRADLGQRNRPGYNGSYDLRAGATVLGKPFWGSGRRLVASREAIQAAQRARSGKKLLLNCQHSHGGMRDEKFSGQFLVAKL
ncbi:hypothetical protein DPMN_087467 [Dreissena polymorpha]|uniref:Uncharacterized protein n=1 Tax=Dreissena polymorpha TaxID=45954 RepID=A0A9D4QWE3_DREPO|nr:hypothetical protein DPMN_087467 [Dreissena polymorpha]